VQRKAESLPAAAAESEEKAATPQLFQPQREALDAAKGVGQTIEQGAKARAEEIDKATK